MLNIKPLFYSLAQKSHTHTRIQENNIIILYCIVRVRLRSAQGNGVQLMSKAEIDTRAPFRSVKEAVMLFGGRVLGSEVYGTKLKEMQTGTTIMESGDEIAVTIEELEETKQGLQKALEESMQMATSLLSLRQELEQTKMELQQLKIRRSNRHRQPQLDSRDIEDTKFFENSTEQIVETETATQKVEFQKKKYVTFANPPGVAQVVLPNPPTAAEAVLQRLSSLRKKKKQFIPLIKGIFSKKKGGSKVALA